MKRRSARPHYGGGYAQALTCGWDCRNLEPFIWSVLEEVNHLLTSDDGYLGGTFVLFLLASPERAFYCDERTDVPLQTGERALMLGLIVVGAWTAFVSGYLVWQQVTGDLADESGAYRALSLRHDSQVPGIPRARIQIGAHVGQTDC
jgi:hypothetical protein